MLYDGGVVGAAMDSDPDAPARARRRMAAALVDAAPEEEGEAVGAAPPADRGATVQGRRHSE